jgi:hypothetical protein
MIAIFYVFDLIVFTLLTDNIMPVQRLDDLDVHYVNVNLDDDDFSRAEHHHQGLSFCSYGFLLCLL